MQLDQFIQECQSDVVRFQAHWLAQHAKYPAHFPLELGPADWLKQFLVFVTPIAIDDGSAL